MRKLALLVAGLLLFVGVGAFANGKSESTQKATAASGGVVNLKLAHYSAPGDPGYIAAEMFAKGVEERTSGQIHITIYPNNALGSPPEQLEQTVLGTVDLSLPTQGALDKYDKRFAVVMLPFIFSGYDQAHRVLDGPFKDWVSSDLEKQGLKYVANWEYGFRNITNNVRPINTPDDVKGLKIRTPPEIQLQAAMEALGANVTKIDFNELYMALKAGVVDGEENPVSVILSQKFYEVQKYLAITHHVYNSMVNVMNIKSWGKLSPDQQKIIVEESQKAGNYMRKAVMDDETTTIKKLESLGMKVTYPDVSLFRAKMGPAYKTIANYAGQQYVDRFVQMVKDNP